MTEKKENVPRLRFPGFSGEWERKKLGEVGKCQSGVGFPEDEQGGKIGVPFYKVSDMNNYGNEHEMTNANNYVTVEQINRKGWKPITEVPAIIFAKVGAAIMLNRKRLCLVPFLLDNNTMAYKFGQNWCPNFGKTLFENVNLTKLVQVGALPSYNSADVENLVIYIPEKQSEQEKIGIFFKQLDKLITFHVHKLNSLKKLKAGLIQKMFPKDGEDFPEVRFPGFTDAWELHKLKDITARVTRKNKNIESTLALTISAQDGLIDQNEFFNKTVASRDVSGYYLIKNGEFAYNKSYSNGYPWGAIKRLDRYDMGVLSTLYIVFKPTNVNSDFLNKYYDTNCWYSEISKRAAEGARNHGLLNISTSEFFETEIMVPIDIEEQAKIGEFFITIDNLITLHQQKLNHLQKQKKALLQQMFV